MRKKNSPVMEVEQAQTIAQVENSTTENQAKLIKEMLEKRDEMFDLQEQIKDLKEEYKTKEKLFWKKIAEIKAQIKNESQMPLLQKMIDSEEPATAAQ